MITIDIQSFFIGMVCAHALSCVIVVWRKSFIQAKKKMELDQKNLQQRQQKLETKPYTKQKIGFTFNNIK